MAFKTSEILVILCLVRKIMWTSINIKYTINLSLIPRYRITPIKEAWSETTVRLQRGVCTTPFRNRSLPTLFFFSLIKELDVVGPPVLMMISRGRLFDYVGVFDEENSALVTPALTEESSILSTLKPFKPLVRIPANEQYLNIILSTISSHYIPSHTIKVWLMMLISLMSVSIYFSTTSTLNFDRSERNERSLSIGDYVLYAIAILTNQGKP